MHLTPTDRATAVIVTAKDAAAFAARAVSSALAQSPVREVIFVDDGSTDDTSGAARSADDGSGRLKIIRLDENRGPAHGRNLAIAASSSPFLCILDADDYMGPDRLDKLFDIGGDDWDLLADDMFFVSAPDEPVFDKLLASDFNVPCDLTLSRFARGNLPGQNRYRRELGFLKPLIRRAFLDKHGFRYDERLRLGEDFLLYASCLAGGAVFRVVEGCGYYAIERPHSLSGAHRTSDIGALYQALIEFQATAASHARSIGNVSDVIRSTRNNFALRQVLDAKRAGGWPAFAYSCAQTPASLMYIFWELLCANVPIMKKLAARPSSPRLRKEFAPPR
jgi:succinoglycan biosynthesis protein ExoU